MLWFLLFAFLTAEKASCAQSSDPAFATETNLIVVDVQVYERRSGKNIRDLTKEDLTVLDNDVPQKLKFLEFDAAPVDILLLLDMSGSMAESTREAAAGARAALETLHSSDRVAVVSFAGKKNKTHLPLTSDSQLIEGAIETAVSKVTRVDSGTRLFDAIYRSLDVFEPRHDKIRRRAVVVVTDDQEQGSEVNANRLTTALLEKNATLQAVILVGPQQPPKGYGTRTRIGLPLPVPGVPTWEMDRMPPSRNGMYESIKPITQETGGEFRHASSSRESLVEILGRVRSRYLAGYILPESQRSRGLHRIDIRFSDRGRLAYTDGTVRSRKSYNFD